MHQSEIIAFQRWSTALDLYTHDFVVCSVSTRRVRHCRRPSTALVVNAYPCRVEAVNVSTEV